MKKSLAVLSLVSVLTAPGCLNKSDGSGSTTLLGGSVTTLEGTWQSGCISSGSASTSSKSYVTFSGNTFNSVSTDYSDSQCLHAVTTPPETGSGTFAIGSDITAGSGLAAKQVNVTLLKDNGVDATDQYFDIFSISAGKLYFGKETSTLDGSTSAKRPTDLDFDRSFTKL